MHFSGQIDLQNSTPQQTARLIDHLVGEREQGRHWPVWKTAVACFGSLPSVHMSKFEQAECVPVPN